MISFFKKKEAPPPPPKLSGVSQKLVYGIGALVVIGLLAPLIGMLLSAVTNLAMAAVIFILLAALFMALPALNRWWRVMVLKMLKESARKNPVETLQLELQRRQQALEAAGTAFVQLSARRDSLRERLDDLRRTHQRSDQQLERMCDKLSSLIDRFEHSLKQARQNCAEFESFVLFQADRWRIAKDTGDLATMLKAAGGGDITDRFLADTSIDTIRDALNTSFAEIAMIFQAEEVKGLTFEGKVATIDLTAFAPAEPATVPRTP